MCFALLDFWMDLVANSAAAISGNVSPFDCLACWLIILTDDWACNFISLSASVDVVGFETPTVPVPRNVCARSCFSYTVSGRAIAAVSWLPSANCPRNSSTKPDVSRSNLVRYSATSSLRCVETHVVRSGLKSIC